MKRFLSTLCAATIAVGTALSTAAPVAAAPVVPKPVAEKLTDVQTIQDRRWQRRGWEGRRGFYRHRGQAYYNGHRGYRDYRRGYRRHGDFWFPAGAFIAGALIGGALTAPGPYYDAPPRRVYRGGGSAHVQWCYDRYRSYRASDNTFQPYGGPRRQCYSPYS